MPLVLCQLWVESERGWGQRPDGYSLHVDRASLQAYVDAYWAQMPETAPDEYEKPNGAPFEVEVSDAAYQWLVDQPLSSVRQYAHVNPRPGERLLVNDL